MKRLSIILLIGALSLSGCQTDTPNGDSPNNTNNSEKQEDNVENIDKTKYENIKVSVKDAFDTFMEKYPDAKINEIELELKHDTYEYEIEGYAGNVEYEVTIDAFTREILEEEESHEDDEKMEIKRAQLDKVDEYVKEALADAGDKYWMDEWELKAKSDYVKFDIELKTDDGAKLKYKYNYETGELLEKK